MRIDSVCISTTSRYIHLHDDPRLDPRESNRELSTLQSRGERFSLLPDLKSSTPPWTNVDSWQEYAAILMLMVL